VSSIEALAADLGAMAMGLSKVQRDAAGAHDAAERIAQRASASGFGGIAQNMIRVREVIREIRVSIDAVGQGVAGARTQLADAAE
jgi:hypothetical protein